MDALLPVLVIGFVLSPWVWLLYLIYFVSIQNKKLKEKLSNIRVLAIIGLFIGTQILMPVCTYLTYSQGKKSKDKNVIKVAQIGLGICIAWAVAIIALLVWFIAISANATT